MLLRQVTWGFVQVGQKEVQSAFVLFSSSVRSEEYLFSFCTFIVQLFFNLAAVMGSWNSISPPAQSPVRYLP